MKVIENNEKHSTSPTFCQKIGLFAYCENVQTI